MFSVTMDYVDESDVEVFTMKLTLTAVDEEHKSSTWVKVQIRIIKYYSSKSTDTYYKILLQ